MKKRCRGGACCFRIKGFHGNSNETANHQIGQSVETVSCQEHVVLEAVEEADECLEAHEPMSIQSLVPNEISNMHDGKIMEAWQNFHLKSKYYRPWKGKKNKKNENSKEIPHHTKKKKGEKWKSIEKIEETW